MHRVVETYEDHSIASLDWYSRLAFEGQLSAKMVEAKS